MVSCGFDDRGHSETVVDDPDAVGVRSSSSPSFLVRNNVNVNAQLYRARDLITMWDFLEHKGRIGRTHVVLNSKEDPGTVRVMPVKCRSRYFDDGRLYMSRRIMKRLGKYERGSQG